MSTPEVKLTLSAQAENLAVVRQALAGLAEAISLEQEILTDIKMAVTEACTNVILHAYPSGEGVMEVEASVAGERLLVAIRDNGGGMQPRVSTPHPEGTPERTSLGLGLPLISTLSEGFEIRGASGRGLEVKMMFAIGATPMSDVSHEGSLPTPQPLPSEPPPGTMVSIARGPVVEPVVSRVVAIAATQAGFSVDRLSDAVLVGDAISAHAQAYTLDGRVCLTVHVDDRSAIDLRVGPLTADGAERLLADSEVPGMGRSLERLTDEVTVDRSVADAPIGSQVEFLNLRLLRR